MSCEFLSDTGSRHAAAILGAMKEADHGHPGWLMTWGAGHPVHAVRLARHRGPWAAWDLGYFGAGHYRVGVGRWHPSPAQIERTAPLSTRLDALDLQLRDDADPAGPILLIGMGPKSKRHLQLVEWEARTLRKLRARFPGRRIRFRPKPGRAAPALGCEVSAEPSIEDALRGASLVVCRHSNAAVDACIAGVPFECEDGAALWLQERGFDRATRLDFLRRLAWWQWRPDEAGQAWDFIEGMV